MKSRASYSLLSALLVGSILVVTANAWMAYRAVDSMSNSEYRVAHTWQVLNSLERILGSMNDAESADRGYLLTGDPSYLAPYAQAKTALPQELDLLQHLTYDSPVEQQRVIEMQAVVEQRLKTLQDGINERNAGETNSIRLLVLTGTGKAEMDHLHAIGALMQGTEHELLRQRTAISINARLRADATLIVASVLDVILLILLFLTLRRERVLRDKTMEAKENLELLQYVSDVNLTRLALGDFSRELLRRSRESIDGDFVLLCQIEDGILKSTAADGAPVADGQTIPVENGSILQQAIADRDAIALAPADKKAIPIDGLKSDRYAFLVTPIAISGHVTGLLISGRPPFAPFDEDDKELLFVVANRIGLAQDRANAYELERSARQLAEESAAQVKALNTELEDRVRLRTAELEAANRELEAFSYSVSHDLRAPLRSVDGISVALEEDYSDQLTDEARDFLRRIRSGVQKMGQLIDALLQLSRITRAELLREPVDITHLAEDVANDLQHQNPARDITFQIQPAMKAEADPRLLRIALENLMGNAVKFTAKSDRAVIKFGRDPQTGEYYVQDNGAGFDMQYSGKLFTAFQRLHGDRDFQGSGIGLATVSRVIRRHGGKISAEGAVGNGATFRFTLG